MDEWTRRLEWTRRVACSNHWQNCCQLRYTAYMQAARAAASGAKKTWTEGKRTGEEQFIHTAYLSLIPRHYRSWLWLNGFGVRACTVWLAAGTAAAHLPRLALHRGAAQTRYTRPFCRWRVKPGTCQTREYCFRTPLKKLKRKAARQLVPVMPGIGTVVTERQGQQLLTQTSNSINYHD